MGTVGTVGEKQNGCARLIRYHARHPWVKVVLVVCPSSDSLGYKPRAQRTHRVYGRPYALCVSELPLAGGTHEK